MSGEESARNPEGAESSGPSARVGDGYEDRVRFDDLMSQFDAIGQMLERRRLEAQGENERAAHAPQPVAPNAVAEEPRAGSSAQHAAQQDEAQEADGADGADGPDAQSRSVHPGLERRDEVGPRSAHRKPLVFGALIAALVAVGGGAAVALAATHTSHASAAASAPPSSSADATPAATPDEKQAALWVVSSVGPSHAVACDPAVCSLLSAQGMPDSSLVPVGTQVADAQRAEVLVSTARLRRALGDALTAALSPQPLATFGFGADQVQVAPVALAGPGDYARRLTLDRAARASAGAALARNPRITLADPDARAALADGLVDNRLASLLALIAASHTVTVGTFPGAGPGAGPDIPVAAMVIRSVDGKPAVGDFAPSRALLTLLAAQQGPYRPLTVTDDPDGLRIAFAQPEPLGLIVTPAPVKSAAPAKSPAKKPGHH